MCREEKYAASWVSQSPVISQQLAAQPTWWLRDDAGNPIMFGKDSYQMDWSVPAAADWWIHLPMLEFADPTDVPKLIDGVFCDGSGERGGERT